MNLLLDTHVLLWSLKKDPNLTKEASQALVNPANRVLVSTVSIAEIRIKENIGKLEKVPPDLNALLLQVPYEILDFKLEHASALSSFVYHHRDPFDWMLIVQAKVEGLTLVTRDRNIKKYDIPILPT